MRSGIAEPRSRPRHGGSRGRGGPVAPSGPAGIGLCCGTQHVRPSCRHSAAGPSRRDQCEDERQGCRAISHGSHPLSASQGDGGTSEPNTPVSYPLPPPRSRANCQDPSLLRFRLVRQRMPTPLYRHVAFFGPGRRIAQSSPLGQRMPTPTAMVWHSLAEAAGSPILARPPKNATAPVQESTWHSLGPTPPPPQGLARAHAWPPDTPLPSPCWDGT